MTGAVDWKDKVYDENYEAELYGLEKRRQAEAALSVGDLEAVLKHLYTMQGADWAGRGELQDIMLGATIAAHESFIEKWKKELTPV